MHFHRFTDTQAFADRALAFLETLEVENILPLGLLHTLLHHPNRYGETPFFATIEDSGAVCATLLRTPPYPLVFSTPFPEAALEAAVSGLRQHDPELPGVHASEATARAFAERWLGHPEDARVLMHTRLFRLDAVTPPPRPAPGHLRPTTQDDRALLIAWIEGFHEDSLPHEVVDAPRLADRLLAQATVRIWEHDGEPVSMAAYSGMTRSSCRINLVYTPHALRGRGYATTCVAALSTEMLEHHGRRYLTLFTDLANPTSNSIYAKIGYRPVTDFCNLAFPHA